MKGVKYVTENLYWMCDDVDFVGGMHKAGLRPKMHYRNKRGLPTAI